MEISVKILATALFAIFWMSMIGSRCLNKDASSANYVVINKDSLVEGDGTIFNSEDSYALRLNYGSEFLEPAVFEVFLIDGEEYELFYRDSIDFSATTLDTILDLNSDGTKEFVFFQVPLNGPSNYRLKFYYWDSESKRIIKNDSLLFKFENLLFLEDEGMAIGYCSSFGQKDAYLIDLDVDWNLTLLYAEELLYENNEKCTRSIFNLKDNIIVSDTQGCEESSIMKAIRQAGNMLGPLPKQPDFNLLDHRR